MQYSLSFGNIKYAVLYSKSYCCIAFGNRRRRPTHQRTGSEFGDKLVVPGHAPRQSRTPLLSAFLLFWLWQAVLECYLPLTFCFLALSFGLLHWIVALGLLKLVISETIIQFLFPKCVGKSFKFNVVCLVVSEFWGLGNTFHGFQTFCACRF